MIATVKKINFTPAKPAHKINAIIALSTENWLNEGISSQTL